MHSQALPGRIKIRWNNNHNPHNRLWARNIAFLFLMFLVSFSLLCLFLVSPNTYHIRPVLVVDQEDPSLTATVMNLVDGRSQDNPSHSAWASPLFPVEGQHEKKNQRDHQSLSSEPVAGRDGGGLAAEEGGGPEIESEQDENDDEIFEGKAGSQINSNPSSLSSTILEDDDVVEEKTTTTNSSSKIRRLPGCIIIGGRKCGTRALLEFIGLNKNVVKAKDEVHFFDEDSKYSLGLDWYQSQMPYSSNPDQITIEKTPAYFVTPTAPERIRAMNASIKLILIVRDPVVRLISDYAQLNANKKAKGERPLRSFINMVLTPEGDVDINFKPVKTSIYAFYFPQWIEVLIQDAFFFLLPFTLSRGNN